MFNFIHICILFSVTYYWISWVIIAVYFLMLPLWVVCVLYNRYTRSVLKTGWVPVLSALFISGLVHRQPYIYRYFYSKI